ncbi:hypothetical protein IF2G_07440 [Cordyceps javanica]|nr:hypothetical protein IF2G_07440 [Cordyceps javanica]
MRQRIRGRTKRSRRWKSKEGNATMRMGIGTGMGANQGDGAAKRALRAGETRLPGCQGMDSVSWMIWDIHYPQPRTEKEEGTGEQDGRAKSERRIADPLLFYQRLGPG